ncbi:hypothetical protein ACFWY6_08985 [Streptomyces sp. NPDC059037]|uniref:hypothetical protein n=1 Tax=Streptomyces sp. NPDC059037 TaxID=3346710 RepID=UPI00367DB18E
MSGAQGDITVGQLLLAEYQVVKDEQKARIGFRDNLLYVTLAAVAALVAATAQTERASMLLALGPVCVVLGWTYLVNDEKISAIGAYVRGDLGPRLAELAATDERADSAAPAAPAAFGWETAHRGDARRRSRKVIQCLVDLVAFCVVPLAGLVVFWADGEGGGLLLALSVVEAAAIAGLAAQVVGYARPFGRG